MLQDDPVHVLGRLRAHPFHVQGHYAPTIYRFSGMFRVRCQFFEVENNRERSARRGAAAKAIERDARAGADVRHDPRAFQKANPVFANASVIEQRHSFARNHEIGLDGLFGTRGQVEVVYLLRLRRVAGRLAQEHDESVQTRELARGADTKFATVAGEKMLGILVEIEVQEHRFP